VPTCPPASAGAVVSASSTQRRLKVCHNRRIKQHKVFENRAARGKTSVDWFFGFKLHLVVNDKGELLNVTHTPGNTDDRTPVPKLFRGIFGRVFGDKGYVSLKLAYLLLETTGVQLITKLRRNMVYQLLPLSNRLLLPKRSIIETVIDQLKNISQIEHSRNRSPVNCLVNIVYGLIARMLLAQEALDCHRLQFAALSLTRTHVQIDCVKAGIKFASSTLFKHPLNS